jgi:DNA-binding IclR family transcriptional regulator
MSRVPAVERSLRVLELMAQDGSPLTLTEIARRTGIPTASCHAILHTLESSGYAARTVVGRSHYWEATLALYHLGAALVKRLGITDVALPHLRALAEGVGCPAHVGVLEGTDVMYIAKAPAPVFIQFDTYPGKASPFHLTALGRAIAAFQPQERQAQLLAGLPERFAHILLETRERGYAVEDSEEIEGVGCVAAPIRTADGDVRASIGITGFSAELFEGDEVPSAGAVVAAASAVSRDLGYAPHPAAPRRAPIASLHKS